MLRPVLGAAIALLAAKAVAQRVPGRDLLTHPLGLSGDAAAFGSGAASGLWNPATAALVSGERARLAMSGLSAPIDLGLTGQVLHAAVAQPRIGTVFMSLAHASISGLVHTETDPQSVGSDIVYSTWVVSVGTAQRFTRHVAAGAAVRWHTGRVGTHARDALATDVGVVVDHLGSLDARVAASSFLLTHDANDAPALSAATDVRVTHSDTLRTVRAGVGYVMTRGAAREVYPFVDARIQKISLRGGPVRVTAYGETTWRMRLAFVLRHAGYTIGVVREDNANGLAPTYQLGVANVFR